MSIPAKSGRLPLKSQPPPVPGRASAAPVPPRLPPAPVTRKDLTEEADDDTAAPRAMLPVPPPLPTDRQAPSLSLASLETWTDETLLTASEARQLINAARAEAQAELAHQIAELMDQLLAKTELAKQNGNRFLAASNRASTAQASLNRLLELWENAHPKDPALELARATILRPSQPPKPR